MFSESIYVFISFPKKNKNNYSAVLHGKWSENNTGVNNVPFSFYRIKYQSNFYFFFRYENCTEHQIFCSNTYERTMNKLFDIICFTARTSRIEAKCFFCHNKNTFLPDHKKVLLFFIFCATTKMEEIFETIIEHECSRTD